DRDKSQPLWNLCLTDDVAVEYPFGSWHGLEKHKEHHSEKLLSTFKSTRHALINPVTTIHGNLAHVESYIFAVHVINIANSDSIIYGGGAYQQSLIRIDTGWRINRHRCLKTWVYVPGGFLN